MDAVSVGHLRTDGDVRRQPEVTEAPLIRDATRRDAGGVARILAAGLADKYGPAYGSRAVEAITAIVLAATEERQPGYLVATRAGALAGVAYLGLDGREASVVRPLLRAIGPLRALRAALVLVAFSKGAASRDEAVLDELAVDPAHRRHGIGTALIEECAARASAAGQARLSLWVTGDNVGARALYAGSGFEVVERRRWPSGRLLFGSRGALRMERRLHPAPQGARERDAGRSEAEGL